MKTHKKVFALFLTVQMILLVISGCKPQGQKNSSNSDSSKETSNSETPVSKEGDKIGSINGVELDSSTGEIIFPYGRINLAAKKEAYEGFSVIDAKKSKVSNLDLDYTATKEDDTTISFDYSWEKDKTSLTTKFQSNEDGSMSVFQSAKADSEGISGLSFGFDIPNSYDVILPTANGVKLSADNPKLWSGTTRIAYPDEWNMQMFQIQGEKGGLLVYSKDNATQFKALNLGSNDTSFQISLETIPQAPFTQYKSFEAVEWVMVPYKGDWTVGSQIYKDFTNKEFGMQEIYDNSPEWAKNIQVFMLSDLDDLSVLDELAKKVDPKKTLLQYPAWRLEPYDVNYPDYTPAKNAKQIIDYAHSLGFRVQLHINMNACEDTNPAYKKFEKYASLDAYSGETFFFEFSDSARSYKFAQINPASSEWRKYMVDTLVKAIKETGADALHLDQSLLTYNDGRGLIEGMTSMQGNVAYHKELAAALPGIAIGAEGITDITARYSSFAQSCTYAIDWAQKSVSESMIDQVTPVTQAVYDSYVSTYHWPGLPTTLDESYWQSWYRACNMRAGFKPTIMRTSAKEITEPNETMQAFLKEAKWFSDNEPKNVYSGWTENTMMRYETKDGTVAEYKKDAYGEVLLKNASDDKSELTRFVTGVENAKLSGTINGWKYYDTEFIRGLDPDKSYLYNPTVRSKTDTHISALPENTTLLNFEEKQDYAAVSLKKVKDDSRIITDFMDYSGPIRAGEVLYESPDKVDLKEGINSKFPINLAFKNLAIIKHLGDRFLMHPPWITEQGSIGYVYTEFDAKIENYGNAMFSTGVQMGSAANAALSDGVTYKFFIWDSADTAKSNVITKTVEVTEAIPIPVLMDIAQFEGKTVTIRIETHPGKTTANDSSVLVEPRIIQVKSQSDLSVSYAITTAQPVLEVISDTGKATMKKTGTNTYQINAMLSETVYFIYKKTTSKLPILLTDIDFNGVWAYNDKTLGMPSAELKPRKQVAEISDELYEGIFAHPPADGKTYVSYIVTVPASGKVTLTGGTGLKVGSSKSDGVRFSVKVNQTEVWNRQVKANDKLSSFSVSLDKYAGKTILLTLVTDSGANSAYDYAFWGNPVIS